MRPEGDVSKMFEYFYCIQQYTLLQVQIAMINRRDQLRGEYEVGYQQEGRPDLSAGPEGPHECLDDPSVDTE